MIMVTCDPIPAGPGYGSVNGFPSLRVPVTITPEQLSVAVAVPTFTVASHVAPADTVWFTGQVIAGACVSLTLTVKLQLAMLPDVSVAVQLTVVMPTEKKEPDAGMQLVVTPEQLSLARLP
jgi:hypothetical protein